MEIYAETIAEAWEESVLKLLEDVVDFIPTEGKAMAKEIRNMLIHVASPWKEPRVSTKYYFPQKYIEGYRKEFFQEYNHAKNDSLYARISKRGQIDAVVKKLGQTWYSRRAVISLWEPGSDVGSPYPPCVCLAQVVIRGGELHLTTVLRSNDAWLSALPDMIVFSDLQKDIANKLGCPQGEYVHHAISYHIYDHDYSLAREAFRENEG